MKWIIGFGLILLLSCWHLVIGYDIELVFLGLPSWLYVFIVIYFLFLALLWFFGKSIKEKDL